jgi:hypothetical protein
LRSFGFNKRVGGRPHLALPQPIMIRATAGSDRSTHSRR